MKPLHTSVHYKGLVMVVALGLTGIVPVAHAEQKASAAQSVADTAREFLSDPGRVGSLTGTILGGALTAHPAGTLAGSIIGFFIGKQSMFESPEKQKLAQIGQVQRSIIPAAPETTARHVFALGAAAEPMIAQQGTQNQASVIYTTPERPSALQQIAAYCYGNKGNAMDPIVQTLCYYRQSS